MRTARRHKRLRAWRRSEYACSGPDSNRACSPERGLATESSASHRQIGERNDGDRRSLRHPAQLRAGKVRSAGPVGPRMVLITGRKTMAVRGSRGRTAASENACEPGSTRRLNWRRVPQPLLVLPHHGPCLRGLPIPVWRSARGAAASNPRHTVSDRTCQNRHNGFA